MTVQAKMALPDLQRYPWKLKMIKNMEVTVGFLIWKLFISKSFSVAFYKQGMRKFLLQRNRKWKKNNLRKHNIDIKFILAQKKLSRLPLYRCTVANLFGIVVFARRGTWNYAYIHFNISTHGFHILPSNPIPNAG